MKFNHNIELELCSHLQLMNSQAVITVPCVLCEYDRSNAVSEVQAIQSYLPRRDVSTEPSLQTGYQSVSTRHLLLCRVSVENRLSNIIIYKRKIPFATLLLHIKKLIKIICRIRPSPITCF